MQNLKSHFYLIDISVKKRKKIVKQSQKIFISLNINVNGHVTYEMNTLIGYFGLDDSTLSSLNDFDKNKYEKNILRKA